MKTTTKPTCKQFNGYLDQRLGKRWSAPFVGSTWEAFGAWCHLCSAWYSADTRERPLIERAMAVMVEVFQPSELAAVKAAIGAAGYESAESELWPRISQWARE